MEFLFQTDRVEVISSVLGAEKPGPIGLRIEPRYVRLTELDAFELSLCFLPVGLTRAEPTPMYTLKEATQIGKVLGEKWEESNGKKLLYIKVDIKEQHRAYDVWLDQDLNWMITRAIHTVSVNNDEGIEEIWTSEYTPSDYREFGTSIYLPQKTKIVFHDKRSGDIEQKVKLNNIKINNSVDRAPPMPLPRAGALVYNKMAGTTYAINERGEKSVKTKRNRSINYNAGAIERGKNKPQSTRLLSNHWSWVNYLRLHDDHPFLRRNQTNSAR